MDTIEVAKEVLTNTRVLWRYVFNEYYRKNEDEPEHPKRFWNVELYTYRVDLKNCSTPRDLVDWSFQSSFQSETIEEAVSYAVIDGQDDKEFEAVDVPDRFRDYWYTHMIDVKESVYIKDKWGEEQLRSGAGFVVYDIFKSDIIQSFSESSNNINYLLTKIPSTLIKLTEEMPFGFSTPEIMKQNPESAFPYFVYNSYIFKTTHYIHDQRCICGDSEEYYNEYDGDNSIKIEIWEVDQFIEKGTVYSHDGWFYYNGQKIKAKDILEDYDNETEVQRKIKENFPEARRYESWHGSYNL